MKDIKGSMENIEAIIQRLRQKTKENGQAIKRQNQKSHIGDSWKESFREEENKKTEACSSKDKLHPQADNSGTFSSSCSLCGGKGFIIKHNPSLQDTITFCKCRELDKAALLWKNSGIEREKSRLTISSYKPYNTVTEKARAAAISYYQKFNNIRRTRRGSIAFLGQVGSGKTHCTNCF